MSDGLENGSKKHDFSTYTVDHYDSKKPDAKKAKGAEKKGDKKDAKKGGVPPELAKAGAAKKGGVPPELAAKAKDAKKGSKAQTESTPDAAEQEIEGGATDTISVVQTGKNWANDHYDGKLADGLNNGYTHNYTNYTVDHYDSKK